MIIIIPRAETNLQVTISKTVFYDGCHSQIHLSIIISHAKLVTLLQLNGFSKKVYSMNGNLLVRCRGYMGNVRNC